MMVFFYFEIHEPYYALVKATSYPTAADIYIEEVAGDEMDKKEIIRSMKIVNRDYALISYAKGLSEDNVAIPIKEVVELFNDDKAKLLLIDGSLL